MKNTNYEITIGYKAVLTLNIKAKNKEEAELKALDEFNRTRNRFQNKNINLQDDSYNVGGILDMDSTWGLL